MERTVVKTYGRGSFLGILSPLIAFVMARAGMNGWERRAEQQMEDDAIAMQKRGYRVASANEYRVPMFGVAWFEVTYEPADPSDSN